MQENYLGFTFHTLTHLHLGASLLHVSCSRVQVPQGITMVVFFIDTEVKQ